MSVAHGHFEIGIEDEIQAGGAGKIQKRAAVFFARLISELHEQLLQAGALGRAVALASNELLDRI